MVNNVLTPTSIVSEGLASSTSFDDSGRAAHVPCLRNVGSTNQPQTLDELLRLSAEELGRCEIARMNLLCATGLPGAENLDVDQDLIQLDAWAERIFVMTESHLDAFHRNPALFENSEPLWRMLGLTRILEHEYQIHYHPDCIDREPDWGDSTALLLHGLLGSQRHGTCPSLPVLVVAVGRRLSYPLRVARLLEGVCGAQETQDRH